MSQETLRHPWVRVIGMDTLIDDSLTAEEQALVNAQNEELLLMSAGLSHLDLMVRLYQGLLAHFDGRDDVFVAADLTWFGPDGLSLAPDVVVVFGLGQQDLSSYRQDRGMPPPTVVFEIVSPNDTAKETARKIERWSAFGAQELWLLDMSTGGVTGFTRTGDVLQFDSEVGVVSPRLGGIRFGRGTDGKVQPEFPDGTPFPPNLSSAFRDLRAAQVRAAQAQADAAKAGAEAARAGAEAARAAAEADALRAQLRALGVQPDA